MEDVLYITASPVGVPNFRWVKVLTEVTAMTAEGALKQRSQNSF